ncbi:PH and SEC7 domain-containing protein 1-like isoform X3 [Acropora muricata]|uniref:PH and SEC7 domain-containing protein 1-like isoform X3 n=2 Tax=Acropora muricata TaxID=159855 RepID=UPI0034E5B0AE
MAHDRYVELERHPLGGFGFSIIGGVDTHLPPMVCALVHNGSAQLSGKVFAGDVILEVNCQPITHFTTNQVVESIRNTQDNLRLRLRDDPGTRERAQPYLRKFAVADPKLAICQARLKRSASAPNNPRSRILTDQLPRKGITRKEEKTMQRANNTSSEDMRSLQQISLVGLEDGVHGIFARGSEDIVERVITDFSVHDNSTSSKTDKLTRPQISQGLSASDDRSSTSCESSHESCMNCGHPINLLSDQHSGASADSASQFKLTCTRCGHVRNYSSGGTNLPGTPYSAHRTFEPSPDGPLSQQTTQLPGKVNGNINHMLRAAQNLADSEHYFCRSKDLSGEKKAVLNGGIKSELANSPSEGLPPDFFGRQFADLLYDSPSDLAHKLFKLEGFNRDEVAPELSKNTPYGKLVALEYLKFFDFHNESITESLQKFLKAFHLSGETQERERILIPFSKRYQECNNPDYGSEDATHTLVCAILLLNSDLHSENLHKKMTQAQFIENLAGLCDGKDFPKDLLKGFYQEIKSKPLEGFGFREKVPTPSPSKKTLTPNSSKTSSLGNPFIEIQASDSDKVYKDGLLYRKVTMGSEGRKTSAWKRKWMPFFATLKGMILFLYKSDEVSSPENTRNCLGVHHSLASRATDYIKKPYVFRFVTSDWREFLFQGKNHRDMHDWIEAINLVAATYSSPPLPAPVGSCKRFQRPVMPFSRTQLSLTKQLEHHEKKSAEAEEQLIGSLKSKPNNATGREMEEWQEKHEFLEYEYKRYKMYVNVLRGSKLESKLRDKPKSADSVNTTIQ